MKKMFKLLVIMFIIYFAYKQVFSFLSKGHEVTYNVDGITVHEIYSKSNGYYFEIATEDYTIPVQTNNKYNRSKRVITDVKILDGNSYKCAYVAIKDDVQIKCLKNGMLYFYNNIIGIDTKLDTLVNELGYVKPVSAADAEEKDNILFYKDNYIDNKNVLLSTYKGAYIFGKNVTNNARFIQLFDSDKYTKDIEAIYTKYYIVADYNSSHEFNKFSLINVSTGNVEVITSKNNISFSSFIQGSYENKIYLIDIANKKQYAIDIKRKSVEQVGSVNSGAEVLTKDGFETRNINDVIDNRTLFYTAESDKFNTEGYARVDHVDNIYYLYTINGNNYDVYIVYENDKLNQKNYAFTCTDMFRINYNDGYVYYIYGDELRAFGTNIGNKTIIKYSELKYNHNMQYYVY